MKPFLEDQFGETLLVRDTAIGLLNFIDSDYYAFTNEAYPYSATLPDVLFASFSWPGQVSPAMVMNSAYVAGSAVYDIDIFAAVNRCLDNGYAEEDIVVDSLLTSAGTLNKQDDRGLLAIGSAVRYF